MSYRTKYTSIIICVIMLSAAFVLPNTTELAEAHVHPDHTFPEFEREFDIDIWVIDVTITLSCEGFVPDDNMHAGDWVVLPHRACFPPGFGFFGPDNNGCYEITYCGLTYRCTGLFCPGDDDGDDDDDDTTGNNDDTTGNNIDTSGNNDDTSGNNDDTSGNNDDTSGNNDDTSGNNG